MSEATIRFQHSTPALKAHNKCDRVHFLMMDFDVTVNDESKAFQQVIDLLKDAPLDLSEVTRIPVPSIDQMAVLSSKQSATTATLKLGNGFLTIELSIALAAGKEGPNDANMTSLKSAIQAVTAPPNNTEEAPKARPEGFLYPPVVRGGAFNAIVPTTDGLYIQYDFDELVFHTKSPFQDVKIYHSNQFGNMLLLDDDPNLAESDVAYTHAIMGSNRYDYKDKTVLILGGGDGGILHEVLKLEPANVIMVEIDQVVVEAATKHLRGICGSSMDQLQGHNYEIRLKDCIPELDEMIASGQEFDFVINDLTAIPVTHSVQGSEWDFLKLVLNKAIKVLKQDGKYITQGNGANMTQALAQYEQVISELEPRVDFSKEPICVPSFHEMWIFYTLWKC